MKKITMFCNFFSSIIWLALFVKFLYNPLSIKPFVVGTALVFLSLEFALNGFNDLVIRKG